MRKSPRQVQSGVRKKQQGGQYCHQRVKEGTIPETRFERGKAEVRVGAQGGLGLYSEEDEAFEEL